MEDNEKILSDQDFEMLQKSVQLLRISQLRYIVQKYSFCITGNKTKLVNVLLNIFAQFRHNPIIVDIHNDVMKIVSQYNEPFANPLKAVQKLRISAVTNFYIRNNFLMEIDRNHILGPIYVPRGVSNGEFEFQVSCDGVQRVGMIFTWDLPEPTPFDMCATINNKGIMVSSADVCPGTIEITDTIEQNNKLVIRSIKTNVPFIITVNFYKLIGLKKYLLNMGYKEKENGEISVMCRHCKNGKFDALTFLSTAIAFGSWNCPNCGKILKVDDIVQ